MKLPNSIHTEVLIVCANDLWSLQNVGYPVFKGFTKVPVRGISEVFEIPCDHLVKIQMIRVLKSYSEVVFILCLQSKSA